MPADKPAMSNKSTHIAILGAGAIGQLIFHQLAPAKQIPYFFVRGESRDEQVLSFCALSGKKSQTIARLVNLTEDKKQCSERSGEDSVYSLAVQTRLLIVCVKAYQVKAALKNLLPQLPTSCHILLLHNGMGPHLEIAPMLSGRGLSLGTTSQGALRTESWSVKQTGEGVTQIGSLSGPSMTPDLKQLLISAIPNIEWCEPILPFLWQKLAINAAINPLTAIENCSNGALAAEKYRQQICDIVEEIVDVALATGVHLDKISLTKRVFNVIGLTRANFSSMHQDVVNQRRTEIDNINGYVVERAKEYGLTAEVNETLLKQVQQLESGYLT
ncbi:MULTISPECIES: ketopantoate reductase family protein [Shewanella]|nr:MULTISPECIES: 2-dehydropantoate 2-reductase [Shewanella]